MDSQSQKDESYVLKLIKYETEKLGINFLNHYGFRCFFNNGDSYGTTTNTKWNNLLKEEWFQAHAKNHYLGELKYITNNNFSYILRVNSSIKTVFLKMLEEYSMNNALAVYSGNKNGINGYYFTAPRELIEATNYFTNRTDIFKKIVYSIDEAINRLQTSGRLDFIPNNKHLFSSEECNLIFTNKCLRNSLNSYEVCLDSNQFIFTKKEIQLLLNLCETDSLKTLSEKLGVSTSTIDFHLCNLRKKTSLSSKVKLIDFAKRVSQLTNIQKIYEQY